MFNQLRQPYRARYGRTPYRLASLGYDAVLLVGADRRRLADRPGLPAERACSIAAASAASTVRSASARSGVAERALQVQQVDAAGLSVVSPAPKGF